MAQFINVHSLSMFHNCSVFFSVLEYIHVCIVYKRSVTEVQSISVCEGIPNGTG